MRRKYDEFENQETDCRPVDCHIRRFVHRRLRYRSDRDENAPKTADVTWTESLDGKKVNMKVTAPPKRAVSMSFATTEMMLTLGLQDQMAGTAFKEEEIYGPLADAYAKCPSLQKNGRPMKSLCL